ncbi:hypothetical protein ACHAWO_007888 [Cyclotella atomus]|uniref:DUF6824 domain-containing protein n=1 Tax=Cyclotella atomus TaxID=382360 RepID=A0ABD3NGU9_9STRA
MSDQEQLKDITTPHDHDVLSGRGNFVNHHAGNENFRALVKKHKKDYVASPKAEKPMYSVLIYDEIRAMDPPGRFLKQDPSTKLWSDIGKKKALDKTRQALREGAPEMLKEMGGGDDGSEEKEVEKKPKASKKGSKSEKRVEDNPMESSFMSIGSFSIDGLNDSMFDLNSSSNQGQSQTGNWSAMTVGSSNGNMQNNNNGGSLDSFANQESLIGAQMQLMQQQMEQWQQIMNLQNPSAQLQPLNLQLQLQNQIGQQQNQIGQQQNHNIGQQQNHLGPQQQSNMFQVNGFGNQQLQNQNQVCLNSNMNNNMNFSQTCNSPNQVNDPNIAALLSAIHSNAAGQNSVMQNQVPQAPQSMNPNMNLIQQLQYQISMQQLNQQINNNNSNQGISIPNTNQQWMGGNGNIQNILAAVGSMNNDNINNGQTGQFGDFTLPLNDTSDGDQIIGMTMPLQDNERKVGGTSYARSQRIGFKNSFTRRNNSHRQLTTNEANSLMSLESLNLDDIEDAESE